MASDGWITYRAALRHLTGPAPNRRLQLNAALADGEVKSRGKDAANPDGPWRRIPAAYWDEAKLDENRSWLQPASRRRVPIGYVDVQVSLADVERLRRQGEEATAPAPSQPPQPDPSAAIMRSLSSAEIGRLGGKKSGEIRRAKMVWIIHANEIAQAAYLANPARSDESIASEIDAGWKLHEVACPGHRTLTVFVSDLRTSGLLPQRSASLPKRSG